MRTRTSAHKKSAPKGACFCRAKQQASESLFRTPVDLSPAGSTRPDRSRQRWKLPPGCLPGLARTKRHGRSRQSTTGRQSRPDTGRIPACCPFGSNGGCRLSVRGTGIGVTYSLLIRHDARDRGNDAAKIWAARRLDSDTRPQAMRARLATDLALYDLSAVTAIFRQTLTGPWKTPEIIVFTFHAITGNVRSRTRSTQTHRPIRESRPLSWCTPPSTSALTKATLPEHCAFALRLRGSVQPATCGKTDQPQAGQQHGVGFGLGNRRKAGNLNLLELIDSAGCHRA